MIKLMQEHIDKMSDEEVETECYKILGVKSWLDTSPENLLGFIIKQLREWNCNFIMDMNGIININFLRNTTETQIHSISIHKAFLQSAFVLSKWKPEIEDKKDETNKARA